MSLADSCLYVLNYLEQLDAPAKSKCLIDNSLEGIFFPNSNAWKVQYYRNEVHRKVLLELVKKYDLVEDVIVLKGVALLELELYENIGQRLTGDIDLLIFNFEKIEKVLINEGYKLIESKTWKGNDYKKVFQKNIFGIDVAIELHQRLFFHCHKSDYQFSYTSSGLKILSHEWMLVHLVGHLAFQHTFLKLHWLLEIHLYIEKYNKELNWDYFFDLLHAFELKNSWKLTSLFIRLIFKKEMPSNFFFKMICTKNFILFPEDSKFRYYIIKFLTKDRIRTYLDYSFYWLINAGWKK